MSANSVGREVDKAQGYINALDNARSEDKWSDVPELIRKVSKHAPHRKCLVQTAHAEAQVVAHITKSRPGTAKGQTTPNQVSNLSELIPELIAAIEAAEGTPQDVFQAQVCLGWVHWTLSEPGLAVVRLPKDLDDSTVASLSEGGKGLTKWTEVCIVKAGYIKSAAQASISGHDTALESASPVLTRLTIPNPALSSCHQALLWSEIFLSKIAMLPSQDLLSNTVGNEDFKIETALKAFRLWSGHPYTKSRDVAASQKTLHDRDVISKSSIWMTYYKVLSSILQYGLPYFPPSTGSSRRQLATELRQVEAICESILLRETKFPLARGSNPQVETWTEDVISNWQVLCGPAWDDEDLGDGGQDAVSRNVLDILYRAATKTYHSHSILRHLFHVHAALAEFDLAMKALDTYVEIVVSAKDRAEKAAEIGHLESDETLLQTVSEGVLLLCCFGSEEEARKAKELVAILEKYIEKDIVDNLDMAAANGDIVARVSPRIMALSYKAIGIGLGTWSRWTPESEARNDIRAEAIENLERSIAPELESEDDTGARYALALLLAESRDLDGAIGQVKTALARKNESPVSETEVHEPYQPEECDKIALWHLLALLLSAKQEFELAGRTCEAAFDQLPHLMTRPGPDNRRSVRENNGKQDLVDRKTAYIQQLQGREKERIIETRMTQLALLEVTDGPEVAVNHSDNLLALFATLFEDLELEVTKDKASQSKQQQTLEPPKSSAGTIKSFRGSIFGRKKGSKIPDRSRNGKDTYPPLPNGTSLGTEAPMIKVTSENANKTPQSAHTDGHHNQRMEASNDADALENEKNEIGPDAIGIAVSDHKLTSTSPSNPKESAKQTLPAVAHNMNHKTEPHPAGHANQPPEQDVRLPTPRRFTSPTKALTKFPTIQAQKHAISVLVKVWLMIAGMYRRASLFDDALEACEEAAKQAASFDALVAAEESSARAFEGPVWGIAKSSEQLWADVHAERGALPEAQSQAYEATQYYEEAIACFPDHPKATIALSNLLLDAWEKNVSLEPVETPIDSDVLDSHVGELLARNSDSETSLDIKKQDNTKEFPGKDEPEFLSRLAARDRAYGLISMLTKTGAAWDNSDAWFTLSRAYEAGSQIEKAKDILWWCVELEDRRPIRHWWNIGAGGYVL